ncbi:MAG: ATP-binding protein, partial [Trueperaceae bacterium]|nr:ATP-binding protein [Trueperaceae bacterium]
MEQLMIGMVLGTEDATPLKFWFAVAEATKVQLDDIVFIEVPDPAEAGERVRFYGIVDEVRRRFEGIQFEGDTELVVQGLMPASVTYAAHVLVTRVEPEDFIPPGPGDGVYMAEAEALEKALYLDNMEAPLPAGVLRNGEAGYLNFDFINGTKGAHINISGISGIATKTSYALFLLFSIFNAKNRKTRQSLIDNPNATKAIIFNVKGEDLLFLDQANSRYREEEGKWQDKRKSAETRFSICQLPERAFASVALHAPAREGENLLPDVKQREEVSPYVWTVHDFALNRMLPFVLTERDAMTNLGFLVAHLEEKLHKLAQTQRGPGLEVEAGDEAFSLEGQSFRQSTPIGIDEALDADEFLASSGKTRLKTFDDLVTYLEYKLLFKGADDDDGRSGGDPLWTAQQAKATREAFIRRLRGASKHVRKLIRGDLPQKAFARAKLDILNSEKQVHVVDIHSLAPLAQMFVVGVLLKQVFDEKESGRAGQIFVVLDELNKYAPSEGESPIKDVLLDIAERGRSMGIILIGAQQTASEVERRIVGNAAVRIVGRLDAAEAERPEYRFMPGSFRLRSTILAPGTMIV